MELFSRACPICDASQESRLFRAGNFDPARLSAAAFSSRKAPEFMHLRLMQCLRCDLVYASPAFSAQALAEAYRDASFEAKRESECAAKTYFWYLRKYAEARPTAALDIGAGDGAFLRELMRHGYDDVTGFEPSQAPANMASDEVRGKLRTRSFDGEGIPDNTFGLVTCFQTLEHVTEPLKLLRDAYRVLAPNGIAFLVGHDLKAISARLLGERSPIYDIEHYQLFSRASAAKIMRLAGFRDVRTLSMVNSYPSSYWVKLLPIPAPLKRRILRFLNNQLKCLGSLNIPLPAGNLAIIATK